MIVGRITSVPLFSTTTLVGGGGRWSTCTPNTPPITFTSADTPGAVTASYGNAVNRMAMGFSAVVLLMTNDALHCGNLMGTVRLYLREVRS